VPLVPDDLPRSPTGRVPQWVIDERSPLRAPPPFDDDQPAGRRPRSVGKTVSIVVVIAALVGAWWFTRDGAAIPAGLISVLAPGHAAAAPPSADVVALADAASLSDEGRQLFYGAQPEILGAEAFAGRCTDQPAAPHVAADGAVGCYLGATDSIVLYQPADPRLHGSAVETAAHETLHAAWERLDAAQRARLTPLLETEVAALPADDAVLEQIAGSVGVHAENRPTELFAYVGTQLWRPGGLAPELETVYARFILDRAALVSVHTAWIALLDQLGADIQTASQALVDQEAANAHDRAQLTADTATVADYRREYDAQSAELAAMAPDRRERMRLSWVWWDGTDLPWAPAEQTLAVAADLLARDEAALPARDAAVTAAEAASALERVRVDGLVADLNGLQRQLDPSS